MYLKDEINYLALLGSVNEMVDRNYLPRLSSLEICIN